MDDVVINKMAIIERCIVRIRQEFSQVNPDLESDLTRQDSIMLNIERAAQACIDLGTHSVRIHKLGIPQRSRDVFDFLEKAGKLDSNLSKSMKAMVGFRNIAVHDYQNVNLDIVKNIVENKLDDFLKFAKLFI